MRLLHTRTLKLEEFGGNKKLRYAILSHTWGAEEVMLQDIKADKATELAGYQKVKMACSIAAKDGFDYVWIDTCCIDKTSSAELSEALNSMYRWYEEAQECYAYLADVPQGNFNRLTGIAGEKFWKSRWFTRGWTLQELIAPSTVIFLDSEWQEIGSKSSLQQIISDITGIPGGFLLGDDLDHASIAQRMSWASKRETTRIEDLAYSLMGMFGIYMPMLYGEGERAFIRLQEEIMKVSNDHSLFAWRSTEDHGGILATSPSAFADSGNIIQKNASNAVSSPLTVSSRGIRLSLSFKKGQQGLGLAVLDCAEVEKESVRLAVRLRDTPLTKEDFTREQSSTLESVRLRDIAQYTRRDLYVRKWRLTRNKKWGDIEKYAIRLEGVDGQEVASHIIHLPSNWELDHGLMATTMVPTSNDILGRILVMCKDGNSFQVLLKKSGRSLFADIQTNLKADSELDQPPTVSNQQQHERDQIVRELDAGQHVQVSIKRRILLFHKTKYVTDVVEINYSSTPGAVWLQYVAVLEGDIKEKTLLVYAAWRRPEAVVKLLLEMDAEMETKDKKGGASLSWAAENGHEAVVKLLLEKGAEVETKDREGRTPLSRAADKRHTGVVKLLLDTGKVDINSKDKYYGRTLLLRMARNGHESIVKLLLDTSKIDMDSKDEYGWTPLSIAAQNGHEAVVKLLLDTGKVDVNSKDKYGWTPLSWAADKGHEAVVKLLLDTGKVDIDSTDKYYGRTPLSIAARNGHEIIVKLLLNTRLVDINSKDEYGWTPLSIAAQNGHEAVVKLLTPIN